MFRALICPSPGARECATDYHIGRFVFGLLYMVCLKSKCTDFPMYELVAQHLVDVYWRVGSDLGYMFILVSTGLVGSVVRYCCLCVVVF